MRRNHLSLILPEKRYHSISSLSSNRSYHIVRSAENPSLNESLFDDYLDHWNSFKRRKSSAQCARYIVIEYSPNRNRSNEQFIRAGSILNHSNDKSILYEGQTLIHLASRLGHEHILRRLIQETPYATRLTNGKGQTPLLCAIQSSSSSTAIFLMDSDPLTITVSDLSGNSIFHYASLLSNDIVLSRSIVLIKRLNSPHLRTQALSRLVEKNLDGKNPFLISIERGSIRCNRLFLSNENLLNNSIDMSLFLNSESVRCAIDSDRIDMITYWLTDSNRLQFLFTISIDNHYNLLEYSIENEKHHFIRLFICQEIPKEKDFLKRKYHLFLNHFNSNDYLTPIQRLLNRSNLHYLIPYLLDQFISENHATADLSIIDDCLSNSPRKNRCLFGHQRKYWSKENWLNEHPLGKIVEISNNCIDDHSIVRLCVDFKYQLFGNILYFVLVSSQLMYVILYTCVILFTPSASIGTMNSYTLINDTCNQLCFQLVNNRDRKFSVENSILRICRMLLFLLSCSTLLKEIFQILTEKKTYLKKFFINLLEIHMYISAIIYAFDFNECTRRTGLRCHTQWQIGAVGLLSVWTSLLLVLMKGIECGKHGLLFITVLLTFLKLIFCYIFIWIGYYLSLYILLKDIFPQFNSFYLIPKLLVMFIGEIDLDSTFFPNNVFLQGSEGALFVYSAFIFTMYIVMSNIMGGLAVADVKEFRLNAKREHLRARIQTLLHLQTNFGFLCEICSKLVLKLYHTCSFARYLFKYDLSQLEIRSNTYLNNQILTHTGLFQSTDSNKRNKFNEKTFFDEIHLVIKKQNELKEFLEDSTLRTNNQLRKIALQLRTEIEELKRHFDQHFLTQ